MMQKFIVLVLEIPAENGANILGMEMQLAFLKSRYLLSGYNPIVGYVHLENGLIQKHCELTRILLRLFTDNSFGASGEKRSWFAIIAGGKEKDGRLFVLRVLMLFRMSIKKSSVSKEYAFPHSMYVGHPIHMIDEMLGCICLL